MKAPDVSTSGLRSVEFLLTCITSSSLIQLERHSDSDSSAQFSEILSRNPPSFTIHTSHYSCHRFLPFCALLPFFISQTFFDSALFLCLACIFPDFSPQPAFEPQKKKKKEKLSVLSSRRFADRCGSFCLRPRFSRAQPALSLLVTEQRSSAETKPEKERF